MARRTVSGKRAAKAPAGAAESGNWVKLKDDASDAYYYFNKVRGRTAIPGKWRARAGYTVSTAQATGNCQWEIPSGVVFGGDSDLTDAERVRACRRAQLTASDAAWSAQARLATSKLAMAKLPPEMRAMLRKAQASAMRAKVCLRARAPTGFAQ